LFLFGRGVWLFALAAMAGVLFLSGVSCGGDDSPTEIGSDDIVRELQQEQRDEQRLGKLERDIDGLKQKAQNRIRARRRPTDAAESASLDSISHGLNGEVGVAVAKLGSTNVQTGGDLTTGSAWSTIKVPIALSLLIDVGGPGGLTSTQKDRIEAAITLSDNAAAAELFAELERRHGGIAGAAAAVTSVLRAGGDTSTAVSTQGRDGFSPYGQTEWSLAAQQRFMAGLAGGCVADQASTSLVLDLMGRVTSDRWGLGSLSLPARWKGGWGPGVDGRYLVRQMGVVAYGGDQLVLTIAARPADGQFVSGQTLATQLAQRVIERGRPLDQPSATTC
jgi:hypothetical protein